MINYYYDDGVKQGFGQVLDVIFGQQAQLSVDASKMHHQKQVLKEWPHPLNIMRFFVPHTWVHTNTPRFVPRNISALSKLLMYPTFVKWKSHAYGISTSDVLKRELNLYPYTQRNDFVVR